jgi:D-alanine-D-alanine ligase
MQSNNSLQDYFVWVLAPSLETNDPNLAYYYDFTQSINEYTLVFDELGLSWKWQPVTIKNYDAIITDIKKSTPEKFLPLVLNLCDGDEVNGAPGVSVIKCLEKNNLPYTGADEHFYNITTSKIPMKRAFDKYGVANAAWEAVHEPNHKFNGIFKHLGTPIIVKPSVSGGSMGVGIKNVVHDKKELNEQVKLMFEGYRGWQLTTDGVIAEAFIAGPEFTTLIVGSYDAPERAHVYIPVERVFHHSLPEHERFLSFDRLWEIYEDEKPMPGNENFYEYTLPAASLIEDIKKLSWDAYVAVKGRGYTRVDLRQDKKTGKLYVLEVNAQCGLSNDENYTSIGAVLRLSGETYTNLIKEVLLDGIKRGTAESN